MATFKAIAYHAPRYEQFIQYAATVPGNCYMFVADDYYDFVQGQVRYQTVGGASATVDFLKVPTGTALASGVSMTSGPTSLTATADTTYTVAKNTTTPANVSLVPGDSIAVVFAGTLTGLVGLVAQCELKPTRISKRTR